MKDFLLTSLVLSLGFTFVLNVVPRLFPNATRKAEAKLHRRMQDVASMSRPVGKETGRQSSSGGVKVFFPWKVMLIASVVLTVLLNLGRFL